MVVQHQSLADLSHDVSDGAVYSLVIVAIIVAANPIQTMNREEKPTHEIPLNPKDCMQAQNSHYTDALFTENDMFCSIFSIEGMWMQID